MEARQMQGLVIGLVVGIFLFIFFWYTSDGSWVSFILIPVGAIMGLAPQLLKPLPEDDEPEDAKYVPRKKRKHRLCPPNQTISGPFHPVASMIDWAPLHDLSMQSRNSLIQPSHAALPSAILLSSRL